MSLMNDALRKKNRERSKPSAEAILADAPARRRLNRTRITLIGGVILTTVLGGLYLMQSGAEKPLQVRPLAVAGPLPTGNQIADSLPATSGQSAMPDHPAPQKDSDVTQGTTDPTAQAILAPRGESVPSITKRNGDTPHTGLKEPTNTGSSPHSASVISAGSASFTPMKPNRQLSGHHAAITARSYEPGPMPPIANVKKNETRASRKNAAPGATHPSVRTRKPAAAVEKPKTGDVLQQAIKSAPGTDQFYNKALAYHRRGRLTDAIRFYQQVLKSNSDHQYAMMNLTAVYIEQGNYVDAQPLLERLALCTPRPRGVLLNLAITAIGTGNPEKALDFLDSAAAVSDASSWEIRFHRAVAFARMNRLEAAMNLYNEVALERPDDSRLRFNLAVTCDELGRYRQALAHYERFVNLVPMAPDSVNQRIRTLRRYLGRVQPATLNSSTAKG